MPSGCFARRLFLFLDFPAAGVAGRSKTNTEHNTKGENNDETKVVNRLRVINSLIEEKGRGKEKVPLDPL